MKFKIACPHNTVTGGIELLHQVAAELNKYDGVTAELWYLADRNVYKIPDDYSKYGNVVNNAIQDDDILIFPEIWARFAADYGRNRRCIYWEGVDAYFAHNPNWFEFADVLHIYQSEYAHRFLIDTLKIENVLEITDYVNDDFLNCDISGKRDQIVLYNPVKGMEFTEKLIRLAKDLTFIPITGMTRAQIIGLMRRSMVWIEFGSFPGKDRLPREAGACGMCVVTGTHGSARYHKDLAIPDEYKFPDTNNADLGPIIEKIRTIMADFESHSKDFDGYRKRLKQEKQQFESGIRELVEHFEV